MKAITALGLSALCIAAALAEPLPTLDVEPTTDGDLRLQYDFLRPITGNEDPQLLAATARKVLELASQQFPGRPLAMVTCLGMGDACSDPTPQTLSRLAGAAPTLRPASECRVGRTIDTRAGNQPAALLRLDSIERRARDFARVHASFFFGADSGAGWRCDAIRMAAQWIVGPCRLTWKL